MNHRRALSFIFTVIGYIVHVPDTSAQSVSSLTKKIDAMISHINELESNSRDGSVDALGKATDKLVRYLEKTLPRIPASLSAPVTLENGWVATSADHTMRIWSWNTLLGGSMPAMENVVEFKTLHGIEVAEINTAGDWPGNAWFDTIFTVNMADGRTCYLPRAIWKGDGRHSGRSLQTVMIADTGLRTNIDLFPPSQDEAKYSSELSTGCEDCPVPQILSRDNGRTILYSRTGGPLREIITSEMDVYTFNGKRYVASAPE
jgi:hypothetical protein